VFEKLHVEIGTDVVASVLLLALSNEHLAIGKFVETGVYKPM